MPKRPKKRFDNPFVFVHVGDLHLTDVPSDAPKVVRDLQVALRRDFGKIIDEIASINRDSIDFVYIPGDIADDGCEHQYRILEDELLRDPAGEPLKHPRFGLHLIPGDHDRQLGNMEGFTAFRARVATLYPLCEPKPGYLASFPATCEPPTFTPSTSDANGCPWTSPGNATEITQFYYAETIGNIRCIFLDLISAGFGRKGFGLDFRLGNLQLCWLRQEIADAGKKNMPCAVFMHCYPVDMADNDEKAAVADLFWNAGVRLVEMGHTHYNELAPDGRTVYAAARSVGQNEDGPVGYAIGVIDQTPDHGIVTSWRFKQLQLGWPFVLITSPADRRMATEALRLDDQGEMTVRALVLTDQPDETAIHCSCQVDGGSWVKMRRVNHCTGMYQIAMPWPPGSKTVSVRVTDGRGYAKDFSDTDTIEPVGIDYKARSRPDKPGSDEQRVGPWGIKGVRGDQAGPNRGRYKW